MTPSKDAYDAQYDDEQRARYAHEYGAYYDEWDAHYDMMRTMPMMMPKYDAD